MVSKKTLIKELVDYLCLFSLLLFILFGLGTCLLVTHSFFEHGLLIHEFELTPIIKSIIGEVVSFSLLVLFTNIKSKLSNNA